MLDYNFFVEYMNSWKDYEFTTEVNPFFIIDGEYQLPTLEIN